MKEVVGSTQRALRYGQRDSTTSFEISRVVDPGTKLFRHCRGIEVVLHTYQAYGLVLQSTFELSELSPSSCSQPDIVIRTTNRLDLSSDAVEPGEYVKVIGDDILLGWQNIGTFLVRGGHQIMVSATPGVDEGAVRLALLGPVLAALLHQRGFLVMHASAVAIGESAAMFVGAKGWGKSTLAATLCGRGHRLLADDVVAVQLQPDGDIQIVAGFPQVKLWPDAVSASIGDDPASLPRLAPQVEKRSYVAPTWFGNGSARLGGVFLLQGGTNVSISKLSPAKVLVPLIQHSYAARFGNHLLTGRMAAAHLQHCTRLANTVPAYTLERPRSLSLLGKAAELVETVVQDREAEISSIESAG